MVELAATPAWFANNVAQIAIVTLLALTVVVVRMVQKLAVRLLLLGLITGVGLFVYVHRDALEACARTCECQIADRDISVPLCDSDIEL